MYPDGELATLERRKAHLIVRSAELRAQQIKAAHGIERALNFVEKAYALWHKYGPLVKYGAIPALFLSKKLLFPRFKILGSLFRWAPVAFSLFRGLNSMRH